MTVDLDSKVTLYAGNLIAGEHEVSLRELAEAFWAQADADVLEGRWPMGRAWPMFVADHFGTWEDAGVTDAIGAAVYELRPWREEVGGR